MSLELLLLFAIFLAALAVLSAAALKTNNFAKSTVNGLLIQKALSDISYIIDDVCVLGEGNVRQLHISLMDNATIISSWNNISINYNGSMFSRSTKCILADAELQIKDSTLRIENNGSRVSIHLP